MSAVVTDQFRIANATNFVESVLNDANSYYVFLGLPNPTIAGFGRTDVTTGAAKWPLAPVDNSSYQTHYRDSMMFGKKITSANIRRVIKKHIWVKNNRYDMYRDDYSATNLAPNSKTSNLYRSNYYVMNSDFEVYICIDNGSSGTSEESSAKGNRSLIEPDFTDVEPITQSDGYTWKYLFTVAPSDIIKFDSTEYIVLPNDWSTTTDSQIKTIRESGNSDVNKNQIKKVYVEKVGLTGAYVSTSGGKDPHTLNILGDGTGGKVSITVTSTGKIDTVKVVSGGSGYTYGIVDLGPIQIDPDNSTALGKLVPIIPPSKGHGYDIYKELGADKVLIYSRFDDSTKDFPSDTSFGQVGIIKNPEKSTSTDIYKANEFSSLDSFKISSTLADSKKYVGVGITQTVEGGTARGYIASYDSDTQIVKYFQDRSLFFPNKYDHTDLINVSTQSKVLKFGGSEEITVSTNPLQLKSIDTTLTGITTTSNEKIINLGVEYVSGVAEPEINKKTGDIIYITNRSTVQRDVRQKEDIKIVLEF
jgi:hypothetical protein|tara:strand:- start:9379 stop:10971 length:1593 start_codon:yes stop_codon:yes gene_type:complete